MSHESRLPSAERNAVVVRQHMRQRLDHEAGPSRKRSYGVENRGDTCCEQEPRGSDSILTLSDTILLANTCKRFLETGDEAANVSDSGLKRRCETLARDLTELVLQRSKATTRVAASSVGSVSGSGSASLNEAGVVPRAPLAGAQSKFTATSETTTAITAPTLARATAAAKAMVDMGSNGHAALRCGLCGDFLHIPTTITCGHSFCTHCLDRYWESAERTSMDVKCPSLECGYSFHRPGIASDNTLCHMLLLMFPDEAKRVRCRWRGEVLLREDSALTACDILTSGLNVDPNDFTLLRLRTQAYCELGDFKSAKLDAEDCCQRQPFLAKSFLCRAKVKAASGHPGGATADLLHALLLRGTVDDDVSTLLTASLTDLMPSIATSNGDAGPMEAMVQTLRKLLETAMQPYLNARPPVWREWKTSPDVMHSLDDLNCPVCLSFYFEPLTLRCGHMICRPCFQRCVDSKQNCPNCRADVILCEASQFNRPNQAMAYLLPTFATEAHQKRVEEYRQYVLETVTGKGSIRKLPIFVCMLVFPGTKHRLRVFESQYVLMVRRTLECETRQFGMCMPQQVPPNAPADSERTYMHYGTMVTIEDVEKLTPLEQTISVRSSRRYKVIDRETLDGYFLATIEWIEDLPMEGEEAEQLMQLHNEVYSMVEEYFTTPPSVKAIMTKLIGPVPPTPTTIEEVQADTNGPQWVWFCIENLPFSEKRKVEMLGSTSLQTRIRLIRSFLVDNMSTASKQGFLYYVYMTKGGREC